MKITSRFTVAVHTLLGIKVFGDEYKTTSEFLASSVNVNPVIIRRVLGSLKESGLIEIKAGSGGARLVKNPNDITLYDIYKAVVCLEDGLFQFHKNPNLDCIVGKNIHNVLDTQLLNAEKAMENELKSVSLEELLTKII